MSISLLGGFFILGLLGHALTRKEESHLHPGNGHVMPQADPARRRLQSAEDDDEPSMWPSRPLFGSNGGLFSHFDDDADFGTRFNPATGLPMVGCIDIGGSFYGFSASWSGSERCACRSSALRRAASASISPFFSCIASTCLCSVEICSSF